ncbi:MAG: SAM-dependent methyltransferase [Candidatus Methanohalarchaeum thermophilum]|uniref:SAM-dependent methyltransferase n=1 Tax=Methanohalarchaeum thermophilum TaxID=1903181 RepID=A0A1Q6DSB3_METT1|nr:MAG: SAM-dependent methyltransferase [Candidatus Methanohalarchaeum thermophilum]
MFDYLAPFYDEFLSVSGRYTTKPVLENASFREDSLVLDVGGGTGHLGEKISGSIDLDYIVLDESEKMLKRAARKDLYCIIKSSSSYLPFRDEVFDYVVCVDALHHFEDKVKSLEEMMRVLKRDGVFYLLDFLPKKLVTRVICFFERLSGESTYFCSPSEIDKYIIGSSEYRALNSFQFLLKANKN